MNSITIQLHATNNNDELTNLATLDEFFAYIDMLFFRQHIRNILRTIPSHDTESEGAVTLQPVTSFESAPIESVNSNDLRDKRLAKFSHLTENLPIMKKTEPVLQEKFAVETAQDGTLLSNINANAKYGGTLSLQASMNPRTVKLREELLKSNKPH